MRKQGIFTAYLFGSLVGVALSLLFYSCSLDEDKLETLDYIPECSGQLVCSDTINDAMVRVMNCHCGPVARPDDGGSK